MTKKEQIEEMISAMAASNKPFVDVPIEIMPKVAEVLYNAGYRKLPEDSVVLSREEICELKYQSEEDFSKAYDLGSKEMAEKIYLQAKAIVDATKHIVQGREYIHIDALKEIIKNCGIEIKE